MGLGDRIRRQREALGLSQRDLADRTGILPTLISRLERGANTNPKADVVNRLALALGCSTDYLLDPHGLSRRPASSELATAAS